MRGASKIAIELGLLGMTNSIIRTDEVLCGHASDRERNAIVLRPGVDGEESVLIGEFAHVAVDRARREVDLAVGLQIADVTLTVGIERREQAEPTTAGGERADGLPRVGEGALVLASVLARRCFSGGWVPVGIPRVSKMGVVPVGVAAFEVGIQPRRTEQAEIDDLTERRERVASAGGRPLVVDGFPRGPIEATDDRGRPLAGREQWDDRLPKGLNAGQRARQIARADAGDLVAGVLVEVAFALAQRVGIDIEI